MNVLQKEYADFMGCVCEQFKCQDALPYLNKGFNLLCESTDSINVLDKDDAMHHPYHGTPIDKFDYQKYFQEYFSDPSYSDFSHFGYPDAKKHLIENSCALYKEAINHILSNKKERQYGYQSPELFFGEYLAEMVAGCIEPYGWGLKCACGGPCGDEAKQRVLGGLSSIMDDDLYYYDRGENDKYPPETGAAPDEEDIDTSHEVYVEEDFKKKYLPKTRFLHRYENPGSERGGSSIYPDRE